MNDNLSKFKARQRERAEKMTDAEIAAYVSRSLMKGEIGVEIAAQRLCDRAGDDRLCQNAQDMLRLKGAEYKIKDAHTTLSAVQATAIGAPIALASER